MTQQSLGNKSFWQDLSKDTSSAVVCVAHSLHLSFPPYYLGDIRKSVKSVVDSRLNHYEEELGGILAGYSKIAILSPNAQILFNLSDIHVNIKGYFYVFKPEVGTQLIGVVNRKAAYGHIGCLVHGLFNVSLPQPATISNREWLGKDAKLQDCVTFIITKIDLQSHVPYIEGNIVKISSNGNTIVESSYERSFSDQGVNIESEECLSDNILEEKGKFLAQHKILNKTVSESDYENFPSNEKVESVADNQKHHFVIPQMKSMKKENELKAESDLINVKNKKQCKRASTAPEIMDTLHPPKKPKERKEMKSNVNLDQADVLESEQIVDRLSILEIKKKRKRFSAGQEIADDKTTRKLLKTVNS